MSRHYEFVGLSILVALALVPALLTLLAFLDWAKSRLLRTPRRAWIWRSALAANCVLLLCLVDGFLIEPKTLTITRVSATSSKIAPETGRLKIIHVSDVHFEERTPLSLRVVERVAKERPDLIILTGDMHQVGSFDSRQFGQFLSRLCSIAPSFGVTGYEDGSALVKASSRRLRVVDDSHREIIVRGTRVCIQGARNRSMSPDTDCLHVSLSHSPDGFALALKQHADWCFCGHTHGGQVRLPFWGAVVTNCGTGKRFEYGRHKVRGMEMFVTRGIGLEPRPAPQVRFLCPPEIVVIEVCRPER